MTDKELINKEYDTMTKRTQDEIVERIKQIKGEINGNNQYQWH